MKNVYCQNCKWFSDPYILLPGASDNCLHPSNIIIRKPKPDFYYPGTEKIEYKKQCFQKNKNNNCKDFEPNLWTKLKEWFL